jgi:predicted kinase
VARLVLINGAPGSGKSTLAHLLAQDRPLTLALDIDVVKHSLGQWEADPAASGLLARRLVLGLAEEHLRSGRDVIVGQYLARVHFIQQLEQLASAAGARFAELVLDVDVRTLAERLKRRAAAPERPEHVVNAQEVSPTSVPSLVARLRQIIPERPRAVRIDASGTVDDTLRLIRAVLADTK